MAAPRPLRLIPFVHRATHRLGLAIASWSRVDVTQPEAHILDHLAVAGACCVGALHRTFAHRRSTLTSVLDRLEARGLVTRRRSAADGRSSVVELTSSGARTAADVHARLAAIEAQALDGVPARQLALASRLLERLGGATGEPDRRADRVRPSRRVPRR